MKLYYADGVKNNGLSNFGDAINPWLWDKVIPNVLDDDQTTVFVGIGTLLNGKLLNRTPKAHKRVIFSSGVGYGSRRLLKIDESYQVYCLRGLLSAQALGLPNEFSVTDGAVLVRRLIKTNSHKINKFAYMPHHDLANEGWKAVCQELGFGYIDPHDSIEEVLSRINQTEVLLAEAMHGAIVADALRVPWVPVVTNKSIFAFKWQDWCSSIDVEYQPAGIERLHEPRQKVDMLSPVRWGRDWIRQKKAASQLAEIAKTARPILSNDTQIERLTVELEQRLQQFKDDIKSGYFS